MPFTVGDKVRHRQRPEWGIGGVTKVETVTLKGQRDQRIWIRFPNAGLKTVLASVAELDRAEASTVTRTGMAGAPVATAGASVVVGDDDTLVAREARHEGGWLGEIAKRKPEDAMTSLAAAATDPFLSLERRLEFVLGLYRFEPVGRQLIDWAVAQSGLDDPLSRFNRHQLEAFFERWSYQRDIVLLRLVQEAKKNPPAGLTIEERIAAAPSSAQKAFRRLTSLR
jgi:Protein of unknown function (DUF3553)